MSRIAEVARLKEPFVWQPIGVTGHYKIVPGIDEDPMLEALLAVAGQFQAGDVKRLELLILNEKQRWTDERWQAAIDCLRRMLAAARIMEGEQE